MGDADDDDDGDDDDYDVVLVKLNFIHFNGFINIL
jgi:hypothetical protein